MYAKTDATSESIFQAKSAGSDRTLMYAKQVLNLSRSTRQVCWFRPYINIHLIGSTRSTMPWWRLTCSPRTSRVLPPLGWKTGDTKTLTSVTRTGVNQANTCTHRRVSDTQAYTFQHAHGWSRGGGGGELGEIHSSSSCCCCSNSSSGCSSVRPNSSTKPGSGMILINDTETEL